MSDTNIETVEPIEAELPVPSDPPADDGADALDSILGEAIDAEAAPAAARDDKGRFAAPKVDGEAHATEGEPAPADGDKPADPDAQFSGWDAKHVEAFQKLTPEAQSLVIERQEAVQTAVADYGQRVEKFVETVQPFIDVVQSNGEYFQQFGDVPPHTIISNLIAHEQVLRSGTYHEKAATLMGFARDYGVPMQLIEADPFADPLKPGSEQYPVVHDLQQQLAATTAKLAAIERQSQQAQQSNLQQSVAAFAFERDAHGQPKHPLFEAVRGTMAQLMTSGQARSLQEAYQQAVAPLEAEIARRSGAASQAAKQRSADAVAKAKRASPVRVSGSPRGSMNGDMSLDQILSEVIN